MTPKRLRRPSNRALLWAGFAGLLAFSGLLMLRACALEWPAWLGANFCPQSVDGSALQREIEAGGVLRQEIADLERKVVARPVCEAPRPKQQAGPLKIDPTKKDLSSLEGCWVSTAPTITNSITGEKLQFVYCFDPGGRTGKLIIKESQSGQVCEGPMTANIDGRRLVFETPGALCGNGSKYPPTRVNCRLDAKKSARCDVVEYHKGFSEAPEPVGDQVRDTEFVPQVQ